jgi:hypothetical protein
MRKMKQSEKKIIVGFSLSPETVKAIEELRGKENRSSAIPVLNKNTCGRRLNFLILGVTQLVLCILFSLTP